MTPTDVSKYENKLNDMNTQIINLQNQSIIIIRKWYGLEILVQNIIGKIAEL